MLRITQRRFYSFLLVLTLSGLHFTSNAARATRPQQNNSAAATKVQPDTASPRDEEELHYQAYKGVRIGMSAAEARKLLGQPADKSDKQDSYVFSDNESAQVYYDASKNVYAVSVMYFGAGNAAPTAKSVCGSDVEARADGSMYKMTVYPKAGFWVSYNRTAGDSPMTIITMQKK